MNKKQIRTIIIVGIIVVAVLALYGTFKGAYNKMVAMQEGVTSQWSQVENQYQRRADLIPNLVNTVKGYAEHEKSTLDAVVEARAKATQITVSPQNLNAQSIAAYQQAQGQLSSALSRLLAVSESYPDLKANQNFAQLQAQLEGTENRISTERKRFNDSVRAYNTLIRTFPENIIANMFGFEQTGYFEAEAGSEKAPEVAF